MVKKSKTQCIGILTSGGDCPGLNAAIRAVTKSVLNDYYNVMIGYDSGHCIAVPLEEVAGTHKDVPVDHPMIVSARLVATCLGDQIAEF